ncbi:MAG: carboxypeptidase regulatory-like domain-containing protein [Alphaproteobacteria bacterium]|nr:carboxypeptidase regulatory-like domain-containing protein [Alphaproteobacteria bacterium]
MRAAWLMAGILVGCSDVDTKQGDTDVITDTDNTPAEPGECISDAFWTFGNQESPLMHPGDACIECHTALGEGPAFRIAGTVYSEYDEPDDCNGLAGIEVEIVDDEGTSWTTTTNSAGNFFFRTSQMNPVWPITATVRRNGNEISMLTPQSTGDCSTCHTWNGDNGAAGRIVAP